MNPTDLYVEVGLELAGYDLDEDARLRVEEEFARIAAIAALLEASPLSHSVEPASTFRS